jgi:hypothetical protein
MQQSLKECPSLQLFSESSQMVWNRGLYDILVAVPMGMAEEEGGLLLLEGETIQRRSGAVAIIVRRHGSSPLRNPCTSARICQPQLTDRGIGFSEAIRNLRASRAPTKNFSFQPR